MSFYGYGWKPYVSVAQRRARAEKAAVKGKKGGCRHGVCRIFSRRQSQHLLGQGLGRQLGALQRLFQPPGARSRIYVRSGSVIALQIMDGELRAQVMGSSLYQVTVSVTAVAEQH